MLVLRTSKPNSLVSCTATHLHTGFAVSFSFFWRRVPVFYSEANLPIPRTGDLNLKCMETNRWEPHRNSPAMTGRLWQAVRWLRRGLADYNPSSANPSDVGANNAYHDPPPRVVARGLAKAPSRQEANKNSRCQHRAGAVLRASPASLAWAGTYPHGCMQLSRCDERLFPRSPYSRRERAFCDMKIKKYF